MSLIELEKLDLQTDALTVANAGAGKTTLLVSYYFRLLEAGYSPAALVVFTFTDKAAGELRERIFQNLQHQAFFAGMEDEAQQRLRHDIEGAPIGTIHQFCLGIIREAMDPNLPTPLRILDEASEAYGLSRFTSDRLSGNLEARDPGALLLLKTFGITHLKKILREYILHLEAPAASAIDLPLHHPEEAKLLEALGALAKEVAGAWRTEKQSKGWLSFSDMEHQALRLIKAPTPSLNRKLRALTHLLVDEFQDTSPLQIELIEALETCLGSFKQKLVFFGVGDPKQSIYRFRKVERRLIEISERRLLEKGGKKFSSVKNYRSEPAILKLVNAFSHRAFPEALASIPEKKEENMGEALLIPIETPQEKPSAEEFRLSEAKWIAGKIAALIKQGHPAGNIAVLFRASTGTPPLAAELRRLGINFSLRGGQELLDRQEIQDLLLLLRFLATPADNLSLVGLLRSPLFGLSDEVLFYLFLEKQTKPLIESLQELPHDFSLPPALNAEAEKLRIALNFLRRFIALTPYWSASLLLAECFRLLELPALFSLAYQDVDAALALEQFHHWIQKLEEENPGVSLPELLRLLNTAKAWGVHKAPLGNLVENKSRVQLLTLHAAKGLEFETVFLADLGRGPKGHASPLQNLGEAFALKIPRRGEEDFLTERFESISEYHRQEDLEENKRLLYVGLTRAKKHLYIPWNSKATRSGKDLQSLLRENLGEHWDAFQKIPESWSETVVSPNPMANSVSFKIEAPAIRHRPQRPHYTVSELETFIFCPLKHEYQYRQGIPDSTWHSTSTLSAPEMGTLLHAGLRILDQLPQLTPAAVGKRLLSHLPPSEYGEVFNEFVEILAGYLKSPLGASLQSADEVFSEWPLIINLPQGALRGQVDRLIRHGKEWRLLDFKFLRSSATEAELRSAYAFQIKTYVMAAADFLGQIPRAEIHLLHEKTAIDFTYQFGDLAAHRRELSALLGRMEQPDLKAVKFRASCHACSFYKALPFCPIPQGSPYGSSAFSS